MTPVVMFGNDSVVEKSKVDPALDDAPGNARYVVREDLGRSVTTMALNEPDMAENVAHAQLFWQGESDQPPAWVESTDKDLEAMLAQQFGCRRGRPKSWKEG